MSDAPIYFRFPDDEAARLALDTLGELGYHAHPSADRAGPALEVFVLAEDLTSLLEIVQAYGGLLYERSPDDREERLYQAAYPMEGIPIPAHVVNEDWAEGYAEGAGADADAFGGAEPDEGSLPDPSGDGYDHFPPGIRL